MKKGRILLLTAGAALIIWGIVDYSQSGRSGSQPLAQPPAATASASTDPETSPDPSDEASASPSASPTDKPSAEPSAKPTAKPTDKPTPSATPDANESDDDGSLAALLKLNAPDNTIKVNKDGIAMVTNADSMLVIVNKKRELSSTYTPDNLVVPDVGFSFSGDSPKKKMQKPAADALEKLFAGAKDDGITLKFVSGYRSYASQKAIFDRNADQKGAEVANQTSAHPGQSEHQTGLAVDVSSASVSYTLEQSFGKTAEGKWLAAHCAEYGFIIRYLKDKQDVTGYTYEPWHIRYVGVDLAKAIMKEHTTLEEYMAAHASDSTKS